MRSEQIHTMSSQQRASPIASGWWPRSRNRERIRSPQVAQAFLRVPREAFVSAFYQRETEPGMVWTLRSVANVEPEQWLALVYHDEPVITKLDERTWPISSSSAPSVMAR